MSEWMLLLPILIPAIIAVIVLLVPKDARWVKEVLTIAATAINLVVAILLYGKQLTITHSWGGFGMDFSLRLYHFSAFIILAAAGFSLLIALYSSVAMKGKEHLRQFYGFLLLTTAFVSGAVLANNLVLMLFFWEGLLVMLFAMIMTGGAKASPTAVKALVLNGAADLCLMLGVGMAGFLSGTLAMDQINLPMDFWGGFAFLLMMIGAIAKAGSMPFHSWIPDAATDAPLPFMAFLPAALEKLLGIYLLARLSLDLFQLSPGSAMSMTMMIVGAVTILLAVMMALIQKDYKRLLSYHAISQVGYMILGIGTALPIGIVGGLFHMINHAMYKSGLFLTAGSVERQAGTTDLSKLGGLARKMPVTFGCFLVAAAAISGVPPFNGFYSKELVFDAALESGVVFYIAAALGAFLTAASFLKLGHAAYFGKISKNSEAVKEAPWPMLVPMIALAALCTLFGVWNALPLNNLIQPILGTRLTESLAGFLPHTWWIAGVSVAVLLLAAVNHCYGVKKTGRGLGAVDHIHYAPGLKPVYGWAEARLLDPYEIGRKAVKLLAHGLWLVDRAIDWCLSTLVVGVAVKVSLGIRRVHTGQHWLYLAWAVCGGVAVAVFFISFWN